MLQVLSSLTPIVLLVATGAALLHLHFYSDAFRKELDRLVYWISLPCLIVGELATAPPMDVEAGVVTLTFLFATVATMMVAYATSWGLGLPRGVVGSFVQSTFRGNLAFVGLPVIILATAERPDADAIQTQALLVFAPMVLFYNVAAVLVLELARPRRAGQRWIPSTLRSIITNPLILACALGIALDQSEVSLPGPISRTLSLTGSLATPAALLSLGGSLTLDGVHEHWRLASIAALLKVAALPLLGWGIGTWLGLTDSGMRTVLVLAATPTAVASYVLTARLGSSEGLATSAIVLSTVMSIGSLAFALSV